MSNKGEKTKSYKFSIKDALAGLFVYDAQRPEERRDFAVATRVSFVILVMVAVIFVTNKYLIGSEKHPMYVEFVRIIPLLLFGGLFGLLGATTRFLSSDRPEIRQRQFRNLVSGSIVGSAAFLLVQSEVLVTAVYRFEGGESTEASIEIDPFGTFFICFLAGILAPELVGYARARFAKLEEDDDPPSNH